MSPLTRRQLLADFLGGLAQAAGTVVLARSVLSEAQARGEEADTPCPPQASLQERADQIVADQGSLDEEEDLHSVSFVNGGFRNGGFRKGGFANGGGGGFRNGGFANGGGGFRKGGFANGGGGGFRNGGFANGGGGGGFRNGAFRNG